MLRVNNIILNLENFRLTANFEIENGSLISIVGPSGAGKSTFLNALAGFLPLTKGNIEWNKSDITNLEPGKRPLSILFQDYNLFSHLTVIENISIGLKPNLKLNISQLKLVDSVIEEVGLSNFKFRKPFQLSGGQKTRVSLARAIVRCKPILLLDESFSGLGPALRSEMIELIKNQSIKNNITLLMVSHHIKDTLELNQKVLFVCEGQLMEPISVPEFLNSKDENIRNYIGL